MPDVKALALILVVISVPMLAIPVVKMLAPSMLPIALILPEALTLLPDTLPVADSCPVSNWPPE